MPTTEVAHTHSYHGGKALSGPRVPQCIIMKTHFKPIES